MAHEFDYVRRENFFFGLRKLETIFYRVKTSKVLGTSHDATRTTYKSKQTIE